MTVQAGLFPQEPPAKKRRPFDGYYTPTGPTQALLAAVPELRGAFLLDPCCGDGMMSRLLMEARRFEQVRLNDINPAITIAASHLDAADLALYQPAPDVVVSNPPFRRAGPIAKRALDHTRRGVALFLRLSFLEVAKGREWLTDIPPTKLIPYERLSFTEDGRTDSVICAWFIWLRGADGQWQRGSITYPAQEGAGQINLFGDGR